MVNPPGDIFTPDELCSDEVLRTPYCCQLPSCVCLAALTFRAAAWVRTILAFHYSSSPAIVLLPFR